MASKPKPEAKLLSQITEKWSQWASKEKDIGSNEVSVIPTGVDGNGVSTFLNFQYSTKTERFSHPGHITLMTGRENNERGAHLTLLGDRINKRKTNYWFDFDEYGHINETTGKPTRTATDGATHKLLSQAPPELRVALKNRLQQLFAGFKLRD